MQEKARIFISSWCHSRFLYAQKVVHFVFKDSSPPVKASTFNPLKPDLLKLYRRSKPDQNMTNLRCTADHQAVPPLNIRPVESGIIPDHFSTGWKNLSSSPQPFRAGPTNPRCILDQHTLSPIKARSLPIRPFFQSGRKRGLVGSLVWTAL